MKVSTVATVIFFCLYFVYKLFGDNENDYWVCGMWFIFDIYLGIISFEISKHLFFKKESVIWRLASGFWFITAVIHSYFLIFNINLYDVYASPANTITLGALMILGFFVLLVFKTSNKKWRK